VGRVHQARIPLERVPLRADHFDLLDRLCRLHALRGPFHRLDGHQERLSVGHRRLVDGSLHARPLRHRHRGMGGASRRRRAARRRGRVGPGRDHRHGQHVFLHRRALHPRPGRGGQLPGSHQGDRRVLPQEGPRLRHLDLQCRRFDRRAVRPADHSAAGEGLGLGDGLHRDRRPGLRLDGLLGLHVQETLGPPEGECRRAGVYRAGPARSGRRRDGRQGAGGREDLVLENALVQTDVGLRLRQVYDRRRVVVLPLLDPRTSIRSSGSRCPKGWAWR